MQVRLITMEPDAAKLKMAALRKHINSKAHGKANSVAKAEYVAAWDLTDLERAVMQGRVGLGND